MRLAAWYTELIRARGGDSTSQFPHDERLLPGEDPHTIYAEDAAHWVTVYSELVWYLRPRQLLRVAADRYEQRLNFWWTRLRDLDAGRAAELWDARSRAEREMASRVAAQPQASPQ